MKVIVSDTAGGFGPDPFSKILHYSFRKKYSVNAKLESYTIHNDALAELFICEKDAFRLIGFKMIEQHLIEEDKERAQTSKTHDNK